MYAQPQAAYHRHVRVPFAGYPVEDAKNQLIAAADILLSLDTALDDEENASPSGGSEIDSRSQRSASQVGRRRHLV